MREYYVFRSESSKKEEEHKEENDYKEETGSQESNEFWEDEKYHQYIEKNGMHFSDKLAEWASKKMKNATGNDHTWSKSDVQGAYKGLGMSLPSGSTWGDATYAANMLYADLGPDLRNELDAVRFGNRLLSDPDGYEGMLFNRYTADIMRKNEDIPWDKLM